MFNQSDIDKQGYVHLYDTVDKKPWRGRPGDAREILVHPQQREGDKPRFILMREKAEMDRDDRVMARMKEENGDKGDEVRAAVATLHANRTGDDDPRFTTNGNPKKAAVEEVLGRKIEQGEFLAAVNGSAS